MSACNADDMVVPGSEPAVEDAMARRVLDSYTGVYNYPWIQNADNDFLSKVASIHNNNDLIVNQEL